MSLDAMKQAIEALEECIGYKTSPFMTRECEAAITALRAAIEEAQDLETEAELYKRLYELRGKALERPCINCGHQPAKIKAIAQPERTNQCGETCERAKLCAVCANGIEQAQEPVAWLVQYPNKHEFVWGAKPQWIADAIAIEPLYTAPRQWQGLTEAEKVNVALDCGCADVAWMDFADALEAKLKEKNHA